MPRPRLGMLTSPFRPDRQPDPGTTTETPIPHPLGSPTEHLRYDALRSAAQDRIKALRSELDGARRRSEELVAEVDDLHRRLNNRWASLSRALRLDHASAAVRSWFRSPQLGRGLHRLPPGLRRQIRRAASVGWWTVSGQLPHRFRLWRAYRRERLGLAGPAVPAPSAIPLIPSERFRQIDPDWIDPQQRPEFIRLRQIEPQARIAVVLHLFYPDLWPEMHDSLASITEPFDLFVSLVAGASDTAAAAVTADFPNAHVLVIDNHGRDILPFLQLLRSGVLFRYDLICKLHGKRTAWRSGGDEWRRKLIGGIVGSPGTVATILHAFDTDPDLGLVVADGQMFTGREFWVANEPGLRQQFSRIGLNPGGFEKSFAGGSIFWIRPFLLRPIDALGLGFDDFEAEPIPVDGATVHVVERLISLLCEDAGMRIAQTAAACRGSSPARRHAATRAVDCELPAAVPPGAGKRRMVGPRLHRVDERDPSDAAVSRPSPAPAAR